MFSLDIQSIGRFQHSTNRKSMHQSRTIVIVSACLALIMLTSALTLAVVSGGQNVQTVQSAQTGQNVSYRAGSVTRRSSGSYTGTGTGQVAAGIVSSSLSSASSSSSSSSSSLQPSSYPGRIIKTLNYQNQTQDLYPLSGAYDPADSTIYSGGVNTSGGPPQLLEANVSAVSLPSAHPAVAYPCSAVAFDTSNGHLILAEKNSSNGALYLQQFNPATDSVTASLPVSSVTGLPAGALYDPVNSLVYVLSTSEPTASFTPPNLTIYNPATNLIDSSPPVITFNNGFIPQSMTFNANYSFLFIAGYYTLANNSSESVVLAINTTSYSKHLIVIPGTFGTDSVLVGGIVYDPFDGMLYFSYSLPSSTSYFPEYIAVINASTQTYVLNFSMPDVYAPLAIGSIGNIAGSLTYDPNNHDIYLTQNGLSWQHFVSTPYVYNDTIAVINGTSPTSANPVALMPTSSYPLGGMFIPSQSSGDGGTLWFPSEAHFGASFNGAYTVAGVPPVISSLSLSHAVIDEGSSVTISSSVSFGVGALTYSYTGLPAGIVSGNLSSISGTPSVNGTFTITLTVTDAAGESVSASVQLTVNAPPTATMSYAPGTVDTGQPVQFTVTPGGGEPPYTEHWVFGDGSTGTGLSPEHVYSVAGSYNVAVTVTDAFGNSYTAGTILNIYLPPSNVTILASRNIIDAGLAVNLTAESQFGSSPLSYAWSLGDSSTSSSPSITHSYSKPGTYVVTLTLKDAAGKSASASYTILVLPDPHAAINSVPTVSSNTSATFSATVSGGLAPYSYAWNFGDGARSTDATPSHAYASSGTYQVTLNVTDSEGYTTTSYLNVTVTHSSTLSTSPTTTPRQNSSIGYMLLGGGLLVVGVVVGAVVAALLVSRRKRPPAAP